MNRKEKIYRKALEIFLKRGYDNTPMSHISKALGISKAALYHHYPSKERLLYHIIDHMMKKNFIPILDEAEKIHDPEARLIYFIKHYTKLMTDDSSPKIIIHEARRVNPQAYKMIKEVYRRVFDLIKGTIMELETSGKIKTLNPSFTAFAVIGMSSWTFYWFNYSRKESSEELANTFIEMIFKGITKH
jgi:TetR/AcrR family transcriptional regulator